MHAQTTTKQKQHHDSLVMLRSMELDSKVSSAHQDRVTVANKFLEILLGRHLPFEHSHEVLDYLVKQADLLLETEADSHELRVQRLALLNSLNHESASYRL